MRLRLPDDRIAAAEYVFQHLLQCRQRGQPGSDTQLVAPVTVGAGAYVGTGTTVRENVPAGSLAVSAGKQRNIEGGVDKKKKAKGKSQT